MRGKGEDMTIGLQRNGSDRLTDLNKHFRLERLTADNKCDWEYLNLHSPHGSFFHTPEWLKVLEDSWHLKARCSIFYHQDDPVAIVPLFERRSHGLTYLTCLPESDISHIVFLDDMQSQVIPLLVLIILREAKKNGPSVILLNLPTPESNACLLKDRGMLRHRIEPFPTNGNMMVDLSQYPPQRIWNEIFCKRQGQRKYIKRFERGDFRIEEGGRDRQEDFHRLYSMNLEYIGANPNPRSHFDSLYEKLPPETVRMTFLENRENIAGGLVSFIHRPTSSMHLRYIALNRDLPNTYHAPYALYWEALNHAYSIGLSKVWFGGTPQDPQNANHRIKAAFGSHYIAAYSNVIPINSFGGTLFKLYMHFKRRRTVVHTEPGWTYKSDKAREV